MTKYSDAGAEAQLPLIHLWLVINHRCASSPAQTHATTPPSGQKQELKQNETKKLQNQQFLRKQKHFLYKHKKKKNPTEKSQLN